MSGTNPRKIIQIALAANEDGQFLYALTADGRVYKRIWHEPGVYRSRYSYDWEEEPPLPDTEE